MKIHFSTFVKGTHPICEIVHFVEPNSTTSNKLLPQSTIDYWTPLLSKLHNNQPFLPELLNKLCDVMTEEGSDSDIVALNWISALITANYIASEYPIKIFNKCLTKRHIFFGVAMHVSLGYFSASR